MKRVVFVVYDTSLIGGAERISLMLANSLTSDYKVTVISLFQKEDGPIIDLDSSIDHFVISDKARSLRLCRFLFVWKIMKLLKRIGPSHLVAVTAGVNPIVHLVATRTGNPWIYWEHSSLQNQSYGKNHYRRQKLGIDKSDHVVVLTQPDKNSYIKEFQVESKKISVIPSYVDFLEEPPIYNLNSKKIVSVGRLVDIKQFNHAILAAKKVFEKHPDWQWDIYGDGEERENLQELIEENQLQEQVRLKGNHKNPIEVLDQYAFLAVTSKFEGGPIVVLEAQSRALPVISYNCPVGPKTLIRHHVNGFLVKDQSLKDLVNAVNKLIESPDLRKEFSDHAMIDLETYSKKIIKKQWKKVLNLKGK